MSKQAYEEACKRLSELTGISADKEEIRIAAGIVSQDAFNGMIEEILDTAKES